MLEHLRAGDAALLVDVADNECRIAAVLGRAHDAHRALAHLTDAAGRRGRLGVVHSLNGIYDQDGRLQVVDRGENGVQVRFRQHIDAAVINAEALRTHFQLALALFARDVKDRFLLADAAAELQQQRGFANAGRAADQNQRAAHGAAAEHAVKFPDPCGKSQFFLGVQFRDQFWLCDTFCARAERHFGFFRRLDQRVPCAACRALPHPFCRLIAAFGAIKNGFCTRFCFHVTIPVCGRDCRYCK